jgi:hypothetical protein
MTVPITDGGAAFPRPLAVFHDAYSEGSPGMSLRDHFAGLALQALLSRPETTLDIHASVIGERDGA